MPINMQVEFPKLQSENSKLKFENDKLKEDNDLLLTILKRVKDVLRLQSGSKNFSDEFEQEIKEAILKAESK